MKEQRDPHLDPHSAGVAALDPHPPLESVRQGASSGGTAIAAHDLGARSGPSGVGAHPRGMAGERQLPYERCDEEHGRQHCHQLHAGLPALGSQAGWADSVQGVRVGHARTVPDRTRRDNASP